jgi:predicted Zn-dependent peptidase
MTPLLLCLAAFAQETAPSPEGAAETPPEATDLDAAPTGPDRSGSPPVADPAPLELEDLTRHQLPSGLEVWHVRIPRVRNVAVEMTWWRGAHELTDHDDAAITLMSELWGVASEKYDAAALSELETLNDMAVYGTVLDHHARVTLDVPLENLDAGLDLMGDLALRPVFPKREVRIAQDETERWLTSIAPRSLGTVADRARDHAWFPADHPYGERFDLERYLDVKHKELPAIHAAVTAGRPVTLLVVGDIAFEDIAGPLEAQFGDVVPADDKRAEPVAFTPPAANRVLAIDMPESEQVGIRMRIAAPSVEDPARIPVSTSIWALGGHFLARFNKNLREDKGWTYGVRSGYSAEPTYGTFSVKVDVPADKLAPAVTELERELASVVDDGITSEELDAGWRGAVKRFNDTRGTTDNALAFYRARLFHERSVGEQVRDLEARRAVTPEDARAVASEWLGADSPRLWVFAGPRAEIEAGLAALGWDAEWITPDDAVHGRL